MKRRDLLKNIGLGTVGVAVSGNAMANDLRVPNVPLIKRKITIGDDGEFTGPANGKQAKELAYDQSLMDQQFFDEHEMATIAVLADIIIPADDKSGSATDAGVPDFIEFIVKDMPYHQVPMRGGMMWLDSESKKQFGGKRFIETTAGNRLKLVDMIAYPELAKPEYSQGVRFFNLMRDLTSTGFYTSEIGVKDIGYMGNQPNFWDGVPQDVLDKHGVSYADWEKHLAK
ncbi:MAG: gluconate 2-dehydrogenase gamma chain [Spirosomataceae bacterium]|jgi:gluconate 2-dehydrogenase gamma chain